MRGGVVTSDGEVMMALAEAGAGLAYAIEPAVQEQLRSGNLVRVLEAYVAIVPGFFLYFPSRALRSGPLRLFVETARELSAKRV